MGVDVTLGATASPRFDFELPTSLEANEPPETRGVERDAVRMLVTRRGTGSLVSSRFAELPTFLEPGDLLVINTSATIPAALDAVTNDGAAVVLHLSNALDDGRWVVELRRPLGKTTERWRGDAPATLNLRGGVSLSLECPYDTGERLWIAKVKGTGSMLEWLETHGRPIRYGYVDRTWPLEMYQNVYANEPGSAEMPSAGRPFTAAMITRLVALGVDVAPLTLHTGVSSLEADEVPYAERVKVPATTAERVNLARRARHRIIAVGTTVVRALETALDEDGVARPYDGWTDLVITPENRPRVVDGMITGWHEPVSSHLMMLEALMGRELLADSYHAALVQGYRWHEFGDVHLILP